MRRLSLAHTGRITTQLGFGCSSIMGALGRADSFAMLEAAYQAGIRHFDVAPSYGFGEAEACLGQLLARHPGELTVTTKFGLVETPQPRVAKVIRALARPVLRRIPSLKEKLRPAAAVGATGRVPFTAELARASLERSLLRLKVERIDLFLLHEARSSDLTDDSLLRTLEDAVRAGKVGAFGVGSDAATIPTLLAERAHYATVLQYEWSVLDALVPWDGRFRLHHRALTHNFQALHADLMADAPRCRLWSEECGRNLADAAELAALMLKASLVLNPQSIILFSSKRPEHIRTNVGVATDSASEYAASRLYALVQAERSANATERVSIL